MMSFMIVSLNLMIMSMGISTQLSKLNIESIEQLEFAMKFVMLGIIYTILSYLQFVQICTLHNFPYSYVKWVDSAASCYYYSERF